MPLETVTLDSDAYEMLRRQRRAGETSRDAVQRLSGRQPSILDLPGIGRGCWRQTSRESEPYSPPDDDGTGRRSTDSFDRAGDQL